jgi:beta-lactamase superfamily II metal-dependent hydrolase
MERNFTHFSVGNGNCSIIEMEDCLIIIDLNKTEDSDSSYDLLKPHFRTVNDKDYIDVLCITHGDEDHCLGFSKFKEEIDNGNLVIGTIWHQGYDRTKNHDPEKHPELPEDYKKLQEEVDRRIAIEDPQDGDLQVALKAKNTEEEAFDGLAMPSDFSLKVLAPFEDDNEDSGYSHNDLSLIINFNVNDKTMLYTGDASTKYWQERIIPDLLDDEAFSDWADADVLEVGHHGSYDFFGDNRDDVRDSDDKPDNYESLDRINPDDLIISAKDRFPLNGDSSGDAPPHYAAWKWYHKWFRDNHSVKKDDKHPKQFKYTSEGNVRLELKNNQWKWKSNWKNKSQRKNQAQNIGKKMSGPGIAVGMGNKYKVKTKNFYSDVEI